MSRLDVDIALNNNQVLSVVEPGHWGPEHLEKHSINRDIAHSIQWVGNVAYRHSDWLHEIADQHNVSSADLAAQIFDPKDRDRLAMQRQRVSDSVDKGNKVQYLVGSLAGSVQQELTQAITKHPHGFIKIERQPSVSRVQQLVRTIAHRGVYACIHDLNVHPDVQRQGIASTMAYVALCAQPKHLKASLYTPQNNAPMVAWAKKYGFNQTDQYENTSLIDGLTIPFVRYEAPSVASVVKKLADARAKYAPAQ